MKSELKAVIVRVTEVEDRISSNDDDIASLQTQNSAMKATVEKLVLKVDDLENRSRRFNLRLVGLPEKKEGADICAFLEKLLTDMLGADNFPGPLLIERAHRIGQINVTDRQSAARPRAVIIKFLNYADKTRVMKAARMKGPLSLDNQRIMLFPDVSADLLKQRKVFDQVKKHLASLSIPGLRYGIVHPAKLLITYQGRRHIFDTTAAAEKFVQGLQPEVCG